MAGRSTLRASDADREQFAERLRHAAAEGRLLAEELEDRLGAVFAARTYGELDATVADLPGPELTTRRGGRPRQRPLARLAQVPTPALLIFGPMVIAFALVALVIAATLFATWGLAIAILWLAFGHRAPYHHRYCRPAYRYRRSMHHAYSRWRV